jgi:two-component system phosphate regulon sensor histidine kinase PhoR
LHEEQNILICVSDSGIGIDETNINRISLPFFQVDSSFSRRHGGTGLGLAIVKHLVESMSGRIEFKSKKGEGTTCFVYLPLRLASKK